MKKEQINQVKTFSRKCVGSDKFIIMTLHPSRIGVFTEEAALETELNKKEIQQAYTVLNSVREERLKRLPVNQLRAMKPAEGISATDIQKYQFMFVDIDVAGLRQDDGKKRNSTEKEHQEAFQVARKAKGILTNWGFPEPLVIDSANGYHLIYPLIGIKATKSSEALLKKCLRVLATRVDTERCKIDTVVSDRARKIKLPGSSNRLELEDARYSKIVELPEPLIPVTEEQLKELSAMETGKTKGWRGSPGDDKASVSDIVDLLETFGDYYYSITGQVFSDVRMEDNKVVTFNVMSEDFRLEARRRIKEVLKLRILSNEMWKDLQSYLSVLASEQKSVFIYTIGQVEKMAIYTWIYRMKLMNVLRFQRRV